LGRSEVVGTKRAAQEAVECLLDSTTRTLKENQAVSIVGFGTFKVSERKARAGRNPLTGQEIEIEAKNVPKFTPGKDFKDAVN
jgi:DNA-binding protein HU-beta